MSNPTALLDETRLLVQVCRLYYEEDRMQEAIAAEVGVSRPTVSRLLAKGRKLGIVNIQIRDPLDSAKKTSDRIRKWFGLQEVAVVPSPPSPTIDVKRDIGREAARLLLSLIRSGDILGLSGGTTVLEAARQLASVPLDNLTIAQLSGRLTIVEDNIHSTDISRQVSQALGGRVVLVPAPAIVRDRATLEALKSDKNIKEALALARSCTVALVGIGSTKPGATVFARGYLAEEDRQELQNLGAVGDLSLKFFDKDGSPCDTFNSRVLSIDLDDFRRISTVLAVAGGGEGKTEAILGALRGGYINALVTDEKTAVELLNAVS